MVARTTRTAVSVPRPWIMTLPSAPRCHRTGATRRRADEGHPAAESSGPVNVARPASSRAWPSR
eukprot:7794100-Lingulodinium_polyedra.AAC.1